MPNADHTKWCAYPNCGEVYDDDAQAHLCRGTHLPNLGCHAFVPPNATEAGGVPSPIGCENDTELPLAVLLRSDAASTNIHAYQRKRMEASADALDAKDTVIEALTGYKRSLEAKTKEQRREIARLTAQRDAVLHEITDAERRGVAPWSCLSKVRRIYTESP